jgi:hypothetical protein
MTKLRAIKVTFTDAGIEYAVCYARGGKPPEPGLSPTTGGEGGC